MPDPGRAPQTRRATALLGALLLCSAVSATGTTQPTGQNAGDPAPARAANLQLQVGEHRIGVEIADTPQQRAMGLMYREALAPDHGMLFVFDRAGRHCMFMRNTRIPLSAAFMDAGGRILAIARMQPFSERLHCAPEPVTHVLEMEQGWFAGRGIRPGDRVEGIGGELAGPAR